jgi:hypothetical protein
MPHSHQNTTPILEDDRTKTLQIHRHPLRIPRRRNRRHQKIIILAWKFIIKHFYQNSLSPVAFTDCKSISKLILGRFAELALGWSQQIKRRIYTNACRGASTINTQKCSRMLQPLATIYLRGDLIYEPATLDLLKKYDLHRYIPHPRRII